MLCTLLIAIGVWALIAQPWARAEDGTARGQEASSSSPSSSSPSPSPSPTKSVNPASIPVVSDSSSPTAPVAPEPNAGPKACNVADITVEALTNQDSYAPDQQPELSLRVTNTGTVPCIIDVGTRSQKFTVTSGRDTWWRSTDCQAEPTDQEVTLEAGRAVTSAAPVVWNRTRSSVATCGKNDRPAAPAGGASYHLQVEIAGIVSSNSKQFLLY